MSRLDKFNALASHAWFGGLYAKLKASEIELAQAFLVENEALNKSEFELKMNRMFLDNPSRPKNFAVILDLLAASN